MPLCHIYLGKLAAAIAPQGFGVYSREISHISPKEGEIWPTLDRGRYTKDLLPAPAQGAVELDQAEGFALLRGRQIQLRREEVGICS